MLLTCSRPHSSSSYEQHRLFSSQFAFGFGFGKGLISCRHFPIHTAKVTTTRELHSIYAMLAHIAVANLHYVETEGIPFS